MKWKTAGFTLVASAVLILAAGCSDDGAEDDSHEGDAATAVALFFTQEKDGGRLPEGADVRVIGVDTNTVTELDAGGTDARFCMEFAYEPEVAGATTVRRVYVASLNDQAWGIEAVNPNGTCEGVA
jgi:hypothetical protein